MPTLSFALHTVRISHILDCFVLVESFQEQLPTQNFPES